MRDVVPRARALTIPILIVSAIVVTGVALSQNISGYNWCQENFPAKTNYVYTDRLPAPFTAAIDAAALTWSSVSSCDWRVSHGSGTVPVNVLGDLKNSFDYKPALDSQDKGETRCAFAPGGQEFIECDTLFNSAWGGLWSDPAPSNSISRRGVAVHEFGHWLELLDSQGPTDVMNTANQRIGQNVWDLSAADQNGARTIYPSGTAPWPSPPCQAGACCKLSGGCVYTDPYTCASPEVVGYFINASTCAQVGCPEITGACCHDERCDTWTQNACTLHRGDWYSGQACTVCSPPPPPPTKAVCCPASRVCYESTSASCTEGDTFIKLGTCDGVVCPGSVGGGVSGGGEPGGCWSGCGEAPPGEPGGGAISLQQVDPCPEEESQRGLNVGGTLDPENREYGPPIGCSDCVNGLARGLARSLRDQMFQSTEGLRFISLYAHHTPQVLQILSDHPALRTHAGNTINDFMPGLRKYLFNDTNGTDFVLTSTRIADLQSLINEIKAYATPGLRADLDHFMQVVGGQQDRAFSVAADNILRGPN